MVGRIEVRHRRLGLSALAGLLWVAVVSLFAAPAWATNANVLTQGANGGRTSWNPHEAALDWAKVTASSFGPLFTITLDQQVDAEPLVVSHATLVSLGLTQFAHDLAVVVTENNTIYGIDPTTGQILQQANLGPPVPIAQLPGSCANNSNVVGITSTPAIDVTAGVVYVVAYTWNNGPVYTLHRLSLATFADTVPAAVISATATLSDGSPVTFNPAAQRQRPALLLSKGNIYAAFGSFCDFDSNVSRGWLLSYDAGTLASLAPKLTDFETQKQANSGLKNGGSVIFLSAIWMSGFGPSVDPGGNVYVITGNSDAKRGDNYGESVLEMSSDLSKYVDFFTPADFAILDQWDEDFGSGGVMILPTLDNELKFAVAAGKEGRMFLMNRANLGHYVAGGPDRPPSVQIGGCWCGNAYFVGSDAKPRIVSAGGVNASTWLLPSSETGTLTLESTSAALPNASQDPGFHTFISSNGETAETAIIWAVSRPDASNAIWLYAFEADGGLQELYSAPAGTWPTTSNNSNIFPTVANGHVFVASYEQLQIFGLTKAKARASGAAVVASAAAEPAPIGGSRRFGEVVSVGANGAEVKLRLRDGASLLVDLSPAISGGVAALAHVGENLEVEGELTSTGSFRAEVARRAKSEAGWGEDTP